MDPHMQPDPNGMPQQHQHGGLTAAAPPAESRAGAGGGVLSTALGLFKRHKRLVQVVVLALIVLFLGGALWKSWSQLSHYSWHVEWGLFIVAFALLVGQELSYAFIWRAILGRMGSQLDLLSAQRIYLGAEFVRYIPGNVWHVITRVLWAEQRGVPKSSGFASMVVELATKITAAVLVFAASLPFWADASGLFSRLPHDSPLVIAAILVPLLLLGLQPRLLRGALNFGLRKLGRQPVSFDLRYRDVLLITLAWALCWLIAGAGFYLLIRSVISTPPPMTGLAAVLVAAGIYALAWDIGFASFITPSGIGFREAAVVVLVVAAGFAPAAGLGVVIAFLARLFNTGAELLCIAGAHLIRGAPLTPLQPQPPMQPAAPAASQVQPQAQPEAR
jgi:glycosyltransferase 2 family protein